MGQEGRGWVHSKGRWNGMAHLDHTARPLALPTDTTHHMVEPSVASRFWALGIVLVKAYIHHCSNTSRDEGLVIIVKLRPRFFVHASQDATNDSLDHVSEIFGVQGLLRVKRFYLCDHGFLHMQPITVLGVQESTCDKNKRLHLY